METALKELIVAARKVRSFEAYAKWRARSTSFLRTALGDAEASKFETKGKGLGEWRQRAAVQVGILEGLLARGPGGRAAGAAPLQWWAVGEDSGAAGAGRKVFVVHGHDLGVKAEVARFLELLSLQAIVLHEQASGGRVILEKFEAYSSDVAFAIVLLTPDDVGGERKRGSRRRPRARQNVIVELGYFLGKLGRSRVCALYKGGVELPSDLHGLVYVDMDVKGAWRGKVVQELVQAGIEIDSAKVLGI